jgi:hypothetical protein
MQQHLEFIWRQFDRVLFVKNGCSFWAHVVLFSIAALLFVILSIPNENLLIKLSEVLNQSQSGARLPASLITVVAIITYYPSIKHQIGQAYLWSEKDQLLAVTTSFTYSTICAAIAFWVLKSASSQKPPLGIFGRVIW